MQHQSQPNPGVTAPPTQTRLKLRRCCLLPPVYVGLREGREGIGNARRRCAQKVTDGMWRGQVTGTDTARVISVTPRLISAFLAAAGMACAAHSQCVCCSLEMRGSGVVFGSQSLPAGRTAGGWGEPDLPLCYRMWSLTTECGLLPQNVFSYYRMCSTLSVGDCAVFEVARRFFGRSAAWQALFCQVMPTII